MRTQVFLLALFAIVVARPRREGGFRTKIVDLRDAVNKTVCPIKVELDYEEARIPKIIKTIRCDHGKARHCCNAHNRDHRIRAHCTELRDDVLVYYPNGAPGLKNETTVKIPMPVGCVCMMQQYSEGHTTPDPDLMK